MTNKQKAIMYSFFCIAGYVALIALAALIIQFAPYGFQIVMGTFIFLLLAVFAIMAYAERLSELNRRDLENNN